MTHGAAAAAWLVSLAMTASLVIAHTTSAGAYVRMRVSASPYGILAQINNIPFVPAPSRPGLMCGWDAMQAARFTKPVAINYENETIDGQPFIVSMFAGGIALNCSASHCWELAVNLNDTQTGIADVYLSPGDEVEWAFVKYDD